ncbi:GerMN domain-containing protein [Candidatus Poriferisodalis sp.]|uniref:GerMN domain-containing protein n=1 Tax=Candidatus Poriferisodalis sp. TaxID=3101277 RepID=UPI003B01BF22
MRSRRAGWRSFGALGACVVTSVACGLPIDDGPTSVHVPAGLFPDAADEPYRPVVGAAAKTPDTSLHPVYFLRDGVLVELQRSLAAPVFLDAPLNSLLAGPTPTEAENGLESAIPAGTEFVDVQLLRNNVISVHLNDVFFEVEGAQRVRSAAQIVFTASALARDSQGVRFFLDGVAQSLPDGAGAIAQTPPGQLPRALRVEDYGELMPPAPLRSAALR